MTRTRLALLLLASALLPGCAGIDWQRGVYEGMRQEQRRAGPPVDAAGTPRPASLPGYERYRDERDALRPR